METYSKTEIETNTTSIITDTHNDNDDNNDNTIQPSLTSAEQPFIRKSLHDDSQSDTRDASNDLNDNPYSEAPPPYLTKNPDSKAPLFHPEVSSNFTPQTSSESAKGCPETYFESISNSKQRNQQNQQKHEGSKRKEWDPPMSSIEYERRQKEEERMDKEKEEQTDLEKNPSNREQMHDKHTSGSSADTKQTTVDSINIH